MNKTIFANALENMFNDTAVIIFRVKGSDKEQIIKCLNIDEARETRKHMFATRNDISFALVAYEREYKEFFNQ